MSYTYLSTDKNDSRSKQLLLTAHYAGLDLQWEKADLSNVDRWNVGSKFPALRTEEGGLWEVNSILRHLARNSVRYPLYGTNYYESSLVDTWLDWSRSDIDYHAAQLFPANKLEQMDPVFVHEVLDKLKVSLDALNRHFLNYTFLASRKVTIADIAVVFSLLPLVTEVFEPGFRKGYPNVFRWFETVVNQPVFLEYLGEVTYCVKSPVPPLPKKQPAKGKGKAKGKKEEGKEDDDGAPEEEEMDEVGEKLDLSYLSELPKSSFVLEKWKTVYANTNPSRPEATDWFWANFDPTGWCLYNFTYKYPEECTLDFKTSNLFGGYLQRLDAVKKLAQFSLCSIVILKKDANFYIYGVWLFRGTEMPVEFTKVDDYNYYDWVKVDVTNPEQRQWVDDIWSWTTLNDWGGRGEFNSGRSWGC